jgi:hypothetical protein
MEYASFAAEPAQAWCWRHMPAALSSDCAAGCGRLSPWYRLFAISTYARPHTCGASHSKVSAQAVMTGGLQGKKTVFMTHGPSTHGAWTGTPRWTAVRICGFSIALRLVVWAVAYGAVVTVGIPTDMPRDAVLRPLTALQNRWDAGWYVGIASGGYRHGAGSARAFDTIAFFPAFPLTLRVAAEALRIPRSPTAWAWTGAVISSVCSAGAMTYLWILLGRSNPQSVSAVILYSSYPFAFFWGTAYSEALFCLAAIGAYHHAGKCSWPDRVIAFTWGAAAGMSRPVGWLIMAPMLARGHRSGHRGWELLPSFGPVFGMLAFSAYVWHLTGHAFEWSTAQSTWGRNILGAGDLWQQISAGVVPGSVGVDGRWTFYIANLSAATGALLCVVPVLRRVGVGEALFICAAVLGPLIVGGVPSAGRYSLILFPIFIWMGRALSRRAALVTAFWFGALQLAAASSFYCWRPLY